MRLGILGPLEVVDDAGQHVLLTPRQQRVVAVLLAEDGRVVPTMRLAERVWDGPPPTARRQLQNCISELRRQMVRAGSQDGLIAGDRSGYHAVLAGHEFDAAIFGGQIAAASAMLDAGRLAEAATALREALGLWRGPALAGLPGWAIEAHAARLEEQRATVIEQYAEVELALGHDQVVAVLTEWVRSYPLRERLVGQFMRALYLGGRTAEALDAYRRLREQLARECGLDPGRPLQDMHLRILRGEEPRYLALMPNGAPRHSTPAHCAGWTQWSYR
jgi:DNA-binding SARP family transcriptional activator